MFDILEEGVIGSITSIYEMVIIVVPIMIFLQIGRDYNVLDKLSSKFNWVAKFLRVSNEAILPILVGNIFGITYGAGVIIQSSKEGDLSKTDLVLVVTFLAICHSIIEDTLIFVAIGANGFVILGVRLILAFALTYLLSRRIVLVNNDITK